MSELVVAVVTYRRNGELSRILPELIRQVAAVGRDGRVLVVDNDPGQGARELVAQFRDQGVSYVHEPVPGIAAARNHALDNAAAEDILVFIDDDEWPTENWLSDLVTTYEKTGAAAVVGAVESDFDAPLDPWVEAGKFFTRRRRLETGTAIQIGASNNLLLDMAVIRRMKLRFVVEWGLSGGSDTLFTRMLTSAGELMVWCDEALVWDRVSVERATPHWVMRRSLRLANTWSRTEVRVAPTVAARLATRVRYSAEGAGRSASGVLIYLSGRLTGSMARRATGARLVWRGFGMFLGAWGYAYVEYRRGS